MRPEEPRDATIPARIAPEEPVAEIRRTRWPGWIWAVPLAAVIIVAYLAFREMASAGPTVTVVFPTAAGIEANQTSVQYDGLKVGEVTSVKLEKDMQHVRARIELDGEMAGHLGPGTLFWIVGPSLTNLASIRSVISGPTIGMQPAKGKKQDVYQGLASPPVIKETRPGARYVLRANTLGSVAAGSQIYYRDLNVGKVETTELQPDGTFRITAFIDTPFDKLIHTGTRFWNAGAVQVSLQGGGPRVQLQSLSSLLTGAIDFETPEAPRMAGPVAPAGDSFTLYDSKSDAQYAPSPDAVRYQVVFPAQDGPLAPHAAVTLAGTRVGSVISAQLQYDPDTGTLRDHAVIAVDPGQIAVPGDAGWPASGRAAMDGVMRRLIGQGLRAQAGSSIPMVGPKQVQLSFVQGAQPATLLAGDPPEIPAAEGGNGLGGVITAVSNVADKLNGIAAKLNGVPLDQIAAHINTLTGKLAELSKSPKLEASLSNLDTALSNVRQVTATAKADVPSVLASLKQVASSAERTVKDARQLISTTAGNGPVGLNQAGLGQTLYQLSRAAESVRELADYLTRHPSALVRGRG